jgi:D-3-phosphoglycerate dehydrogenase/(S)-sulfolactate dehydrogenase
MKVLVADDLAAEGTEILRKAPGLSVDVRLGLRPADLESAIGDYDALAVRSATKVTREVIRAGTRLKVIGRAGVGVDNIDLGEANKRGVVVMNTPGGNTITVAEHAIAMMMALSRHIPQATASVKQGRWEKKKFEGRELFNKVLGVIGIGNIGSVVVDRCLGMKMKVLAFDPFISAEAARRMGCELVSWDDLLQRSDYISVHVPLIEQTRNLIGRSALARIKPGAYLINCSRGGVVDEESLYEALSAGKLGGAALDVFATEPVRPENPLLRLDNFICTPHLGASTEEAQRNVAVALAEQLVDFLCHGNIRNAVNVPSVSKEVLEQLGPWLNLAHKLGLLAGQLCPEAVTSVEVGASGEINQHPIKPITLQAVKGLLSQIWGESVNEVSAPTLAQERGIEVVEKRRREHQNFVSSLSLIVKGKTELSLEGTVFGRRDPRIVRVNGFDIEAVPAGHLVAIHNRDVPGVVGRIGTVLGDAGVNIGRIHLSRDQKRGEAFSLINVDSEVPSPVLEELRQLSGVLSVRQINL